MGVVALAAASATLQGTCRGQISLTSLPMPRGVDGFIYLSLSADGAAAVGTYSHNLASEWYGFTWTQASPSLNINDFVSFMLGFAAQSPRANSDRSTSPPILNANDFQCFLNAYAAGCPS